MIHTISTQPNFARHIKPIYEALPDDLKGEHLGISPRIRRFPKDDVFLVGGYGNIELAGDRPVIYIEHGAGQSYVGVKTRYAQHYAGGPHPDNVIGYVCPNEHVAARWKKPSVVVGCPAVDRVEHQQWYEDVCVITFHCDFPLVCPEARSARPHYIDQLHEIIAWIKGTASGDVTVLGHAHPRDKLAPDIWANLNVEFVPDPDEVLARATLVIADNTSFAYEAALVGIHNVVLNAPWYRRDVHHGLRFWSHPPGVMVDSADELMSVPYGDHRTGLNDHVRTMAAQRAYGLPYRGGGAELASEFITNLVG